MNSVQRKATVATRIGHGQSGHAPSGRVSIRPTVISSTPRVVGRYLLCDAIASGGMATVHLARLMGPEGFSRTVAVKQLHPQFARDPEFVAMFLDEARLASRVRHPNVVSPLDVISSPPELFMVMDYVHGEPLSRLLKRAPGQPVPANVAVAIVGQVLLGLHAAHVATGENGELLELVHRDVSPHNILVTEDGVARVVDFGIAKARARSHQTERGKLKGKLGYMAPEQVNLEEVDRRTDVFAVGVVLWELLTGRRLFAAESPAASVQKLLNAHIPAPSTIVPHLPRDLDDVVLRALARPVDERFVNARAMAEALDAAITPCSMLELSGWVATRAAEELGTRADLVLEVEGLSFDDFTRAMPHPVPTKVEPPPVEEPSASSVEPAALSVRLSPSRRHWVWAIPLALLLGSGTGLLLLRVMNPQPAPQGVVSAPGVVHAAAEPVLAPPEPPAAALSLVEPAGPVALKIVKPAASVNKTKAGCEVPYTIDKSGVKRFKEACF